MHHKALKAKRLATESGQPEEIGEIYYNLDINTQRSEFKSILKIAKQLHDDYVDIMGKDTINWFFITVRPTPETTWEDFYDKVYKFTQRKCIQQYTLSFEQKGTNEETLGTGFHFHMVANTTHRSKGECLRDTQSTFAKICADNAVQINPTKNPNDIIQKYLINYEANDGHKACTKEWDEKWRNKMGLKPLYTEEDPLSKKIINVTIETKEDPTISSIKSEQRRLVSWD